MPSRRGHHPVITGVHGVLPVHRYAQHELTDLAARLCLPPGTNPRLLRRLHASARVEARHLALPLDRYPALTSFTATNDAWLSCSLPLAEEALLGAFKAAGVDPGDIDLIVCTSVTGLAVPSLDARLAVRLGMRRDVKRLPVFALGCVAGACGIARAADYLRGFPGHTAVLLSVELCSLTAQRDDPTPANLVASALFGDGAGALVMAGADAATARAPAHGTTVVDSRSVLFPDTEGVMGWAIGTGGFAIVLGAEVPDLLRDQLGPEVREFLARHALTVDDVAFWVCHPGGPRVLDAVSDTLALPTGALDASWRSLAAVGNLSSASVLHILRDTLDGPPLPRGSWGLLLAMGPGLSAELVLLRR